MSSNLTTIKSRIHTNKSSQEEEVYQLLKTLKKTVFLKNMFMIGMWQNRPFQLNFYRRKLKDVKL